MGLFDSKPKGVNLKEVLGNIQSQFNGITFNEKSRTDDKVEITASIEAKKYFETSAKEFEKCENLAFDNKVKFLSRTADVLATLENDIERENVSYEKETDMSCN